MLRLPLISDERTGERGGNGEDLLAVRMLNEYAYCPRLFYLMHVEGRWDDNVYTVEGKHGHRRVDQLDHVLPDPDTSPDEGPASSRPTDTDEPPQVSRSVSLASESLGLTAKARSGFDGGLGRPFPSRRNEGASRRTRSDRGSPSAFS
jgi:hypothetical protein